MKLLNLGCGDQRPTDPQWTNLDDLHAFFLPGTPERDQLDTETNYVNWNVHPSVPLPFPQDHFDGILASHFFEHWDAQECLKIMCDCRRILKPGGVLMVSVPDASYFRRVHAEDRNENWPRLFGVTDPANPIPTWMEAALFFEQHKQVFTADALWCAMTQAGFEQVRCIGGGDQQRFTYHFKDPTDAFSYMLPMLNRRQFSLEMLGIKKDSK